MKDGGMIKKNNSIKDFCKKRRREKDSVKMRYISWEILNKIYLIKLRGMRLQLQIRSPMWMLLKKDLQPSVRGEKLRMVRLEIWCFKNKRDRNKWLRKRQSTRRKRRGLKSKPEKRCWNLIEKRDNLKICKRNFWMKKLVKSLKVSMFSLSLRISRGNWRKIIRIK